MTIILDGTKMGNRKIIHAYLKEQLELPDYYGENLDALWDLLSTESRKLEIIITDCEAVIDGLGEYGERIIETITEAADENKNLHVELY